MPNFLMLRLSGHSLYFGSTLIDNYHLSDTIPPKSLIVGLLANALGYDRSEYEKLHTLQDSINYAIRIDRAGIPFIDYQTVQIDAVKNNDLSLKTGATHIKYNSYLADGIYLIALSLDHPSLSLDDLLSSLNNPARSLFIGRYNCVPNTKIALGISTANSFEDVLTSYPQLQDWDMPTSYKKNMFVWLPVLSEDDLKNLTALDSIKEFTDECDYRNRIYGGQRFMKRKNISLPVNDQIVDQVSEPDQVSDPILIEPDQVSEIGFFLIKLKIAKDKMLNLAMMHKGSSILLKEDIEDVSYECHVLLKCLLGDHTPNRFHLANDTIEFYSLYSLDHIRDLAIKKNKDHYVNKYSLNVILWDESTEENLDHKWQVNDEISFEIDLVPIRQSKGKEKDAYDSHLSFIASLDENDPRRNMTKEQVYIKWFLERFTLPCTDIKVLLKDEVQVVRKNHQRKNHLKSFTQPNVLFAGNLKIFDLNAFKTCILNGIGRQSSFGIGMFRFL